MNDDDLENRLGRLRPAEPPRDLMRRLRDAEPAPRWVPFWRQPWPLAYAALLAVWVLIGALRMATPSDLASIVPASTAQADVVPNDAPAFASTLAAERAFIFARNSPEQP